MNRAVLVGVDDYAKQTGLEGCVNDVLDLQRLLVDRRAVDEAGIVVLADGRATKATIVDALIEMIDALRPGDRGYFHFSGHGARLPAMDVSEPDGMSEVLCPHDFDWSLETSLGETEVLAILDPLRLGARLIVSLDACQSGDFSRGLGLRGRPRTLAPPAGLRAESHAAWLSLGRRASNVTLVAACSPW